MNRLWERSAPALGLLLTVMIATGGTVLWQRETARPELVMVQTGTRSESQVAETAPTVEVTPVPATCVNPNLATQVELDALRGIGEARARAIINGRPYAAVDELLSRKIIPSSVFLDLQSQFCL